MRAKEFLKETGQSADTNIQQLQTNISTRIKSIFDINDLNQIYSYIRKIDLGQGFDSVFNKDTDLKQVHSVLSKALIDIDAPFE